MSAPTPQGSGLPPAPRRSSNLPYFIASLLALAVVATAWVARDRHQPVGPGARAPAFEAVTLDGAPARIQDFQGQVVLLNVWATWCPPCVYEMPSMQRLYEHFEGADFEIIAVSIDAPQGLRDPFGRQGGDVAGFADEYGLTFPIWLDPDGTIQRIYRTTGVPESFVIGRDGVIYRKVAGATEWDDDRYIEFIDRLLDESA
jgi:cytochrome c biogenesis protein CcmG, thiol:disulfide interchange protein DsbE